MSTTFEKTWAYDMNRAITPATALDLTRRQMWHIAAALTGNLGGLTTGLWTLYASSNSVTAGTDSTDRWVLAGPYDGTKIVRGASTAVHSWIVLASPTMAGSTWYLILSFNSAIDTSIRLSFSKQAPTSGSTTVTPFAAAAVNQWWPFGGTVQDWPMNAGAQDNSRFSCGLTSAGDFYFLFNKQAANVANLCIIFSTISNSKTNDAYKVWSGVAYHASGALLTTSGLIASISNSTPNPGNYGQKADGIASSMVVNPLLYPGFSNQSGGGIGVWNPTVADVIDSTYCDFPLWIMTGAAVSGNPTSIRGRLADFAFCPYLAANLAEGSVTPSSGTIESSKAGCIWFPANAAFNFA